MKKEFRLTSGAREALLYLVGVFSNEIKKIKSSVNANKSTINELSRYDVELEKRIINDVAEIKEKYAYLSVNLNVPVTANIAGTTIPYPDGFDKDNCKVISLMGYDQAQYGWFTSVGISTYRTYNLNAFLGNQGITVRVQKASNISTSYQVPISIYLMKKLIEEE